ncbi:amphi-Trp domain-containing protein [Actinomycetospora sp. TBRC 11914]|uniref:amphi-Trp domain-containing protein n=1 Tax=Actinomycetospora sp. TBRC 11914 TaxID=2729387 RepID=UPI00145E7259|nr:amphi-Trp domain-containing protein [Actinomycetospora sp. TBRC 11914]NMO88288.1 amphi-Trp domain-containing protein [Actinomycetospora sp. TBRC 11914]
MLKQMSDMPAGTVGFEAVGTFDDDDFEVGGWAVRTGTIREAQFLPASHAARVTRTVSSAGRISRGSDPDRAEAVRRVGPPARGGSSAMAEVKIEQKVTLGRQETARWLADLAKAIDEGGTVEVPLAGPTVTLHLPEEFRCETEVEVDGDEVELELELKWSPASGTTATP